MTISILRRFNYTNRIDIPKSAIDVDVTMGPSLRPHIAVMRLELPDGAATHGDTLWQSAIVILEAWQVGTNSFFRREIGRVSELDGRKPPIFQGSLDEFTDSEGLLLRIKVVSAEKKLLAEADRIRISDDDTRSRSDLILVYPRDLGQELWRVDWSEAESIGPMVFVNKHLRDPRGFITRNAATAAAIVPQIVREVLTRLLAREDLKETAWALRWMEFTQGFYSEDLPESDDGEAIEEWVKEAIQCFAAKFRFFDHVAAELHNNSELEE